MRAFLRSIVAQGGAQIATVFLALFATKIIAIVLGAAGTGFFALLRQLHDLAISWVGLGVGQGLVQGMSARDGESRRLVLATGWRLYALAGIICLVVFMIFPDDIATLVMGRGDAAAAAAVRLIGVTAAFGLVANLLAALLQVHGSIVQYAVVQILGNIVLAVTAYPVAIAAIEWPAALTLLIAMPLIAQAVATLLLNRHLRLGYQLRMAVRGWGPQALRHFLGYIGFGLAQLAIGIGSGLLVRALIVHAYRLESVGHFQAAWALSAQSIALLLTPFATYAIPKMAATRRDRAIYERVWHDMAVVVWAVTVPVVVVGIAFKSLLLQLFYSSEFLEAIPMLQWMLIANLVKSASWLLATPFLAAGKLKPHLALGILLDGSFVLGVWAATSRGLDLQYIGIAFMVSYSLYMIGSWILCSRYFALRFNVRLARAMIAGVVLVGAISAWTWNEQTTDWPAAIAALFGAGVVAIVGLDVDRRATLWRALAASVRR